MRKMQDVQSSMVTQVGTEGSDLLVRFKGGKLYRYINAASHHDAAIASPSIGQYINVVVKPNFGFEVIAE